MPFHATMQLSELLEGEIEVESFFWGVTQLGDRGAPARAHVQDFSFVKRVDATSPLLFARCCAAQPIREAVFVVRRSAGAPEELVRYSFGDVRVASIRPGGSARGADDAPLEEVTLGFARCTVEVLRARAEWGGAGGG